MVTTKNKNLVKSIFPPEKANKILIDMEQDEIKTRIRLRNLELRFPEERKKILQQLRPVLDNLCKELKTLEEIKYKWFAIKEPNADNMTDIGMCGRLLNTAIAIQELETVIEMLERIEKSLAIIEPWKEQ